MGKRKKTERPPGEVNEGSPVNAAPKTLRSERTAEPPRYTVGLLIANLKLRTENLADANRLTLAAEALERWGEDSEFERYRAQLLSTNCFESLSADQDREDYCAVEMLVQADGKPFTAESVRQLCARLAVETNCSQIEIFELTLEEFAQVIRSTAIEGKQQCEWPDVNIEASRVLFRGESHDVTPESARLVHLLADARGDWVSMHKNGFTKASDLKRRLPEQLRRHIISESGKGYRWEPSP